MRTVMVCIGLCAGLLIGLVVGLHMGEAAGYEKGATAQLSDYVVSSAGGGQ